MSFPEYYGILGVDVKASPDEIKSAYHNLVKKYHPDVNKNKKQATEKLKQINEAYGVLGNLARRAEYDYIGHIETLEFDQTETINPQTTAESYQSTLYTEKSEKKHGFRFTLSKVILSLFLFVYVCFVYSHIDKKDPLNLVKTSNNILDSVIQTGQQVKNIYKNKTWLLYLVENDYTFTIKFLPNSIDLAAFYDENKYNLLQKTQNIAMAKVLLNKGSDVNYRAPDGNTALSLAVKNNNVALTELFLQKGADVNIVFGINNYNLLMMTDNPQIAEILIKYGAKINYLAKDGMSPLRLAAHRHTNAMLNILHKSKKTNRFERHKR